ncbi:MAG: phosphoglycerate kinase [Alphaproteobacteria bacterium]|nr:phosphoglycerate kinase [Alphaproteobacteria bacterium]MBQ8677939.1 phosphoglycerate kinase [Alphaproteobacteria bacterium]
MQYKTIDDLGNLNGKVVMLRADLNVPMDENFKVTNTARIDRTVPTIKELMSKGAKVVVISHFGRPEGKGDMKNSLSHIVKDLEKSLGHKVIFVDDCIGEKVASAIKAMKNDEVLLLENLRFYDEEKKGNEDFAKALTAPVDAYVSDAFSTAHRAHASMVAAVKTKPAAFGRLMEEEVNALSKGLNDPQRPLMAIVGGSKVSTKLDLLNNLVKRVNKLVISGGMAHTFMKASGIDTVNEANSLVQMDMIDTAKEIMATAKANNCEIVLPEDVVVSKEFKAGAEHKTVDLDNIPTEGWSLLDVGEKTIKAINAKIDECKTLVWNGPLGVFELKPFDTATNAVAQHAAERTQAGKLMTVAGGGDTVSALANAGVEKKFTYISTAGGAFLEWMEGKELPGVAVLKK